MFRALTLLAAGLCIVLFAVRAVDAQVANDKPLTELQKIERLIKAVERADDAVFVRKGTEETGRRAAAALRIDFERYGSDTMTAEEFIQFAGDPAYAGVTPFTVRYSDGTTKTMAQFLTERLQRIESRAPARDKSAPPTQASEPADPPPAEAPTEDEGTKMELLTIWPLDGRTVEPLKQRDEALWRKVNYLEKRVGKYRGWAVTQYIRWNHLGRRTHLWDRFNQRDRLEYADAEGRAHVVCFDIKTQMGAAWIDGQPVTDEYEQAKLVGQAWRAWSEDVVWMFLPFMLQDPGVNVKYVRLEPMPDNREAHVFEVTFEKWALPVTHPKYRIYASQDIGVVEMWDCYDNIDDIVPARTMLWTDWQVVGGILLSMDRSELDGQPARMTDFAVYATAPEEAFTNPAAPALPAAVPQDEYMVNQTRDILPRANADEQ